MVEVSVTPMSRYRVQQAAVVPLPERNTMAVLDTSYHRRRHAKQMKDLEYTRAYELARQQIEQVDAIMQQLDGLRTTAGMSKARLARAIGKDPAAVRRLFTAEVNPELKTVAAMAAARGNTES
jgi:hypothetical protein